MKLPEDKQERNKVLILCAMGVGATLYVLVRYAIMPIIKANKTNEERIAQVTDILEKAEFQVKLIHTYKDANKTAIAAIRSISATNLLHPQMNINYQIPASIVLDRIEQNSSMDVGKPAMSKGTTIPGPSIGAKKDLKTWNANISLKCTYAQLVRLLRTIRDENPYIAVSRITIAAQAKSPEEHQAGFTLTWPIWAHPEMAATVSGNKPGGKAAAPTETESEGGNTR